MRALENDMKIGTFELKGQSFSVDTRDDFLKAKVKKCLRRVDLNTFKSIGLNL